MNVPTPRRVIPLLLVLLSIAAMIGPSSARATAASPPGELYMLEDVPGRGVAMLAGPSVTLYLRMPPFFLVSATPGERAAAERGGAVLHAIGRPGPRETLYLLSRPGAAEPGAPSTGRVLFRTDRWLLAAADESIAADRFGRDGYRFSVVPLRPLPLDPRRSAPAPRGGASRVSLPAGVRARSAMSDSSLTAILQRLEAYQTRYSFTDSVIAAAEWIHDQFIAYGFTDVVYDSFFVQGHWQRNVVATLPGSANPDQVIVIGGHYDSVTYDGGCDPMTWAPGVDDNGTGTAMTMELARMLVGTNPEVTLRFVPFAAEEQGLFGSWHYAEEAFNSGMDIRLMVNMDMIANVDDATMDVNINTDNLSMGYAELMRDVAEDSTSLIPRIGSGSSGSDHWPFQQYGYPHVYIEEGDFSPNWHRCTDTFSNIDIPYLVQVENMVLPTVILVANAPAEPAGLVAHDEGDGESYRLDWDANPEPDVRGYRIYTGPDEASLTLTDSTTAETIVLTGLTEGETLQVGVAAVDDDGYEGVMAGPIAITPLSLPRPPVVLEAVSRADEIEMSWRANEELDLDGYIVYRAVRGGAGGPVDTLAAGQTVWIDTGAQAGIYYLYEITAIDLGGGESDPSEPIRGRLASHDGGVLVVDATRDGTGGAYSPTDEAVDQFYDAALAAYAPAGSWDYADSILAGRRPVDADLGFYSTVVWHRDDRFGEEIAPDTTEMAKFLDTGGNLLLGGWSFLRNLSGSTDDFASGSFFHDYLKVVSFETTGSGDMDFSGADGLTGSYPDVAIDPQKVPLGGLFSLDYFDAAPAAGAQVYAYAATDPGSPFEGEGMGIEYRGADFGVIVLGFPLYYLDAADARGLLENAMDRLGESPTGVGGGDGPGDAGLPRAFALGQNYPNPFNPSTTISFAIPAGRPSVSTRVMVYDVRGRRVRTVTEGDREPGAYQVHWDGRDERGARVASGVYIYTIEAGDFRATRKMLLAR